jgi:desulfoferrodoxin (superoxide reductase-like protein)
MSEEHYIQFIETFTDDKNEVHIKFFKPDDVPQMDISFFGDNINYIEYCNIHKLWGENKMLTNESGNYSI